jgi:hypothetical protein
MSILLGGFYPAGWFQLLCFFKQRNDEKWVGELKWPIRLCMCIYIYITIFIYSNIYIYIHPHIHTYTHIHTHISCISWWFWLYFPYIQYTYCYLVPWLFFGHTCIIRLGQHPTGPTMWQPDQVWSRFTMENFWSWRWHAVGSRSIQKFTSWKGRFLRTDVFWCTPKIWWNNMLNNMFQHHFALEYFGIKGVKWLISSQPVPPLTGRWTQRPAGMSTSSSLQWVDKFQWSVHCRAIGKTK